MAGSAVANLAVSGLGGAQVVVPARVTAAALAIQGPGALAGGQFTDILIFDAGSGGRGLDPIARFYDEDAGTLDWLEDYLRDARLIALVRNLIEPPEEEEEAEELYNKEMSSGVDGESSQGW